MGQNTPYNLVSFFFSVAAVFYSIRTQPQEFNGLCTLSNQGLENGMGTWHGLSNRSNCTSEYLLHQFQNVAFREMYAIMEQPQWWRRQMTTKMKIQGRAGPLLTDKHRKKFAAVRKMIGPKFSAFGDGGV